MPQPSIGFIIGEERSHWIRLRTIILLRWVAILGQLAAIGVGQFVLGLQLPLLPCLLAVGVAAFGNLLTFFVFPTNARMSEPQNFLMVLFDLCQLCFLLFMTGGLNNPFAILVLGPVTVSASVMGLRPTLAIGATAIALVTLLVPFHLQLVTAEGFQILLPDIFVFGNWIAVVTAILFIGGYTQRISSEIRSMSDALAATQLALAREQKLTDLGGVVAAAAHELGTPLATIKLTSGELIGELEAQPDLREDARLIRDQAARCSDILRSMGQMGKDDLHMRKAPISALLDEAAGPHMERGREILVACPEEAEASDQPEVLRQPEIIHGLRNLIQNAVDFSQTTVWADIGWTKETLWVRISDDGPGFPATLQGRLGDPFLRQRRADGQARENRRAYEGMGLGLFIAKTLLERTGARLQFLSGFEDRTALDLSPEQSGAVVLVTWPRKKIDANWGDSSKALGPNRPMSL